MTDSVIQNARKSVRIVLISQVLVLVLGVLKTLLIPLVLGVRDFAYWQIYIFYIAYVGLFTLGFNDGIYLRYGGVDFADLCTGRIRTSIRMYFVYLLALTSVMGLVCSLEPDPNKRVVLYFACLNIAMMGMMAVFTFALQATGRLQQFGVINTIDKISFLVILLALFLFKARTFSWFVIADLISKLLALAFMCISCKGLIKGRGDGWNSAWSESKENVLCGLKLMLANLSGMLVLGVGRLVVEYWGSIENYAFYAFGVSMTNLALVALTSISIVLYPVLKRLPEDRYQHYFNEATSKLFIFSLIMLGAYFPVVWLIEHALSKYMPVIPYLNLLFVVTVLQGKMQLIINNFYKVLRFEGQMLRANLESLAIVVALSAALFTLNPSVMSIAIATLLTMAYRVFMSERFLRRAMGGVNGGRIGVEAGAYTLFIVLTGSFEFSVALLLFCLSLASYFIYAKSAFKEIARLVFKGGGR